MTLVKKLKSLKERKEWTNSEVARFFNVSPRTVEGWMQGRPMSKSCVELLKYAEGDA